MRVLSLGMFTLLWRNVAGSTTVCCTCVRGRFLKDLLSLSDELFVFIQAKPEWNIYTCSGQPQKHMV